VNATTDGTGPVCPTSMDLCHELTKFNYPCCANKKGAFKPVPVEEVEEPANETAADTDELPVVQEAAEPAEEATTEEAADEEKTEEEE
jgi:hypothetical protein